MRILQGFLNYCTVFLAIVLLIYVLSAIRLFYCRKEYGIDTAQQFFQEISPVNLYNNWKKDSSRLASRGLITAVFFVVILLGGFNFLVRCVCC